MAPIPITINSFSHEPKPALKPSNILISSHLPPEKPNMPTTLFTPQRYYFFSKPTKKYFSTKKETPTHYASKF